MFVYVSLWLSELARDKTCKSGGCMSMGVVGTWTESQQGCFSPNCEATTEKCFKLYEKQRKSSRVRVGFPVIVSKYNILSEIYLAVLMSSCAKHGSHFDWVGGGSCVQFVCLYRLVLCEYQHYTLLFWRYSLPQLAELFWCFCEERPQWHWPIRALPSRSHFSVNPAHE